MTEPIIQTYREFWPFYLSQHRERRTQILHTTGLVLALTYVLVTILSGYAWFALAAPVIGYGFAWYSHFFIEHNRPATWKYPVWSFVSDFRLAFFVLIGRRP